MSNESAIDEFEYKKISGDMSIDDSETMLYQIFVPVVITNDEGDLITDSLTDSGKQISIHDDYTDKYIIHMLLLDAKPRDIELTRNGAIIYVDDTDSGAPLLELHEVK